MVDEQTGVATAARLLGRDVHAVRRLAGGEHAATTLITDGRSEYVVRTFPPGDQAVAHELEVLERLGPLGDLAPRMVTHCTEPSAPTIVTTRVAGSPPLPSLPLTQLATGVAGALARIHELDGTGLRTSIGQPPPGDVAIAARARRDWPDLHRGEPVLTHYDYWCGNTLWQSGTLTGVVDWSGARQAPRGVDLAWCRLDLVLMGDPGAADTLLATYEQRRGAHVTGMAGWDRYAAAQAHPVVETWSGNYLAIGRRELTPEVLRSRLTAWTDRLLGDA